MKLPKLPKPHRPQFTASDLSVLLELIAFVVISAGIAMVYVPAGVIAFGVALWWIAQSFEAGDPAPVPVGTE